MRSGSHIPPLLVLASALVLSNCFDTRTTRCSWGRVCPEGLICDPVDRTCIYPSQAELCQNRDDGDPCHPPELLGAHVCVSGICRRSYCGDALVDPRTGEVCDDGNTASGDGCRADCLDTEWCGNGLEDPGEECDDGNLDDNDQCTRFCQVPPVCGDGLLSGDEVCDDATQNSDTRPDACRTHCQLSACGDTTVDTPDPEICWTDPTELDVACNTWRLYTGDLNGDGLDDLLLPCWEGDEKLDVLVSNVQSGYSRATGAAHELPAEAKGVAVADFNGDTIADVVVSYSNADSTSLQVFLGDGTGLLTPQPGFQPGGIDALNRLAAGQVTGNASADIVAFHDSSCSVVVVPGLGDGTFTQPLASSLDPGGCESQRILLADLDDDGHLDVIVTTGGDGVLAGKGSSTGDFTIPAAFSVPWIGGSSIYDAELGDVNGDGLPDLVYTELLPPKTPLHVLLNQGGFVFVEAPDSPILLGQSALRLDVGDLDADGDLDVLVGDIYAPVLSLLLGRGDGTFEMHHPSGAMARALEDVRLIRFHASGPLSVARLVGGEQRLYLWSFDP